MINLIVRSLISFILIASFVFGSILPQVFCFLFSQSLCSQYINFRDTYLGFRSSLWLQLQFLGPEEPLDRCCDQGYSSFQVLCWFPSCVTGYPNWWFKTTEISSLTVLQTRSPKIKVLPGHAPTEGSREETFLASSSFILDKAHQPLPVSTHSIFLLPVFLSSHGLFLRILNIGFRSTLSSVISV